MYIICRPEGPDKRGHIVADTLLSMMFLGLRKLGNICYGHKMFLNKIRNIFCVPDTKFVSATNVARAGKWGNICVGNNVSSFARAFAKNCARGLGRTQDQGDRFSQYERTKAGKFTFSLPYCFKNNFGI